MVAHIHWMLTIALTTDMLMMARTILAFGLIVVVTKADRFAFWCSCGTAKLGGTTLASTFALAFLLLLECREMAS